MLSPDEFDRRVSADNVDYRVRLVLDHAKSNLTRDLSLTQLAALTNLSEWHICRLFKKQLGISPAQCIKLARLKAASALLVNTTLSVKEVMANVGMNDQSHFVRDFEVVFGCSPSTYRICSRNQKIVAL